MLKTNLCSKSRPRAELERQVRDARLPLDSADIVEFAGFRFNRRRLLLYRLNGGDPQEVENLNRKALEVLSVLAEPQKDWMSTAEILEAVWPGMVGQLDNLYHQISFLRRVLEENQETGAVIKAVKRRGYKIAVPIVAVAGSPPPVPVPSPSDTALPPLSRPMFYNLPSLPNHYQSREAEIAGVHSKLLQGSPASPITSAARAVDLLGMVGIGKTVLATALVRDLHQLDLLEPPFARAFLAEVTGTLVEMLPTEADEIIRECGRLPLALAAIGALIRCRTFTWADALIALQKAALELIDTSQLPDPDQRSLAVVLKVSVDSLGSKIQRCYYDCRTLQEAIDIPEETVLLLWFARITHVFGGKQIPQVLGDRSLMRYDTQRRYRTHDSYMD